MIYALDLRAIWLLPVFWVDIPADRLSFVLEGKQNACWFYSNERDAESTIDQPNDHPPPMQRERPS